MHSTRIDFSGQKFGMLTVLSYSGTGSRGDYKYATWLCKCDCGTELIVRASRFKTEGNTLSCGCRPHGNRKYPRAEAAYRQCYKSHGKPKGSDVRKWGQLPFNEWMTVVTQDCIACGAKPERKFYKWGDDAYINGVDRIDSFKNYELGNVQPMCSWCNIAKAQLSTEEFISHCLKVAEYQSARN